MRDIKFYEIFIMGEEGVGGLIFYGTYIYFILYLKYLFPPLFELSNLNQICSIQGGSAFIILGLPTVFVNLFNSDNHTRATNI